MLTVVAASDEPSPFVSLAESSNLPSAKFGSGVVASKNLFHATKNGLRAGFCKFSTPLSWAAASGLIALVNESYKFEKPPPILEPIPDAQPSL